MGNNSESAAGRATVSPTITWAAALNSEYSLKLPAHIHMAVSKLLPGCQALHGVAVSSLSKEGVFGSIFQKHDSGYQRKAPGHDATSHDFPCNT